MTNIEIVFYSEMCLVSVSVYYFNQKVITFLDQTCFTHVAVFSCVVTYYLFSIIDLRFGNYELSVSEFVYFRYSTKMFLLTLVTWSLMCSGYLFRKIFEHILEHILLYSN